MLLDIASPAPLSSFPKSRACLSFETDISFIKKIEPRAFLPTPNI